MFFIKDLEHTINLHPSFFGPSMVNVRDAWIAAFHAPCIYALYL